MAEVGRPSEMTEEKVKKLEEVFAIDGTVEEACFYADISKTTYYNWLEKKPELVDRFNALRNRPILKARQTIVKGLDKDDNAKWYLERKTKEFKPKNENETTHIIPEPLLKNLIKPNEICSYDSTTEDNGDEEED